MAVAKQVDARDGSIIGLALAPRLVMAPGTRVLAGLREVAVGGAAAGLVIAFVLAMGRRLAGR